LKSAQAIRLHFETAEPLVESGKPAPLREVIKAARAAEGAWSVWLREGIHAPEPVISRFKIVG
jgi:hypothetical protein